jgi:LuxR family maltose regulon positive regulatory protein
VETNQVILSLKEEDWSAVDRWAITFEQRFGSADPFRYEDESTHITQARIWIAQKKPDQAARLLSCLEEAAQAGGRHGRLIEILTLRALALQAAGEITQALAVLTKSLTLAETDRFVRVFLDEGLPMKMLLTRWLAHSSSRFPREYGIRLLSQFDGEQHVRMASQEKIPSTNDLVEPLSPRELEVLRLMALGRTNLEIARQLIVSRGTIKAHTASIYRKLEVANRTEAAARARQLGILDEHRDSPASH